jgi:hypothetical protein
MSDKKRIDLQKHVPQKVPRSYVIRIAIYVGLVAGLMVVIYFMRDNAQEPKAESLNYDTADEIHDYTIDTTEQ